MRWLPRVALAATVAVCLAAAAQEFAPDAHEVGGRMSGYLFLGEDTRALQDDDFLNPGMFAVEEGRALWDRVEGTQGVACASCHGDAAEAMRGVAARYPVYDADLGGLVNLEMRINAMRRDHMGAEPYPPETAELLALTAFVTMQSRGLPMSVDIDGPARPYFEAGREFFNRRRGQLDMACSQCHDDRVGQRLRGDVISQGQVDDFPIYRLMWNSVASRHRMFAWCNTSLRAEPFAANSEEYLALELYVAWRGRGLAIGAPGVRR